MAISDQLYSLEKLAIRLEALADAPTSPNGILTRLDDLERRVDAMASAIDVRLGECRANKVYPHWHHWLVKWTADNPIGRECKLCGETQMGTMMWDEARRAELLEL